MVAVQANPEHETGQSLFGGLGPIRRTLGEVGALPWDTVCQLKPSLQRNESKLYLNCSLDILTWKIKNNVPLAEESDIEKLFETLIEIFEVS